LLERRSLIQRESSDFCATYRTYRLMKDHRVSVLAKAVPFIGLFILLTPPALELDLVPLVGELDWLVVGYISLKLFLWLCPPEVVQEHVLQVGRGA